MTKCDFAKDCAFENVPELCRACRKEVYAKDTNTLLGTEFRSFVAKGCEYEVLIAEPPIPKKNLYERCVLGRIKP